MPIIPSTDYRPPFYLFGKHLQTIFPSALRSVRGVVYQRERIGTPDGDFLDLDWARNGNGRLAVVSHGLEGNSTRPYVLGAVRALGRRRWDALAWNFRGCGGEPNRTLRLYHSGATEDLGTVVGHVLGQEDYRCIALVGFSLGGNMVLKYLGERGEAVPEEIKAAVTFSVPLDLRDGAERMGQWENRIYMRRFLRQLRGKVETKARQFPGQVSIEGYEEIRDFRGFDDRYTAPLHGFRDAEDYWKRCSARFFLREICRPALIVNARNDPFLGEGCYPVEEAGASPWVFLEMPDEGGHVGFSRWQEECWSEERAGDFLEEWGR